MYLQGDLQVVFDVLYNLGVIDPVLEEDWGEAMEEFPYYSDDVSDVIQTINGIQGDFSKLMCELGKVDERVLSFIAIEVAKEFADFHSREELH